MSPEPTLPGVFEMLKIGIGPSSSHTLGPWRAAEQFAALVADTLDPTIVGRITVTLYGSLALTGLGHGTDIALMMGLSGYDPVTVPLEMVHAIRARVADEGSILVGGAHPIPFLRERDIILRRSERLPAHANGMIFTAFDTEGHEALSRTAYSIGGGFVQFDDEESTEVPAEIPHNTVTGARLLRACHAQNCSIATIARENERVRYPDAELDAGLAAIWDVMRTAVHRGCRSHGILPGGLEVHRRAPTLVERVTGLAVCEDADEWYEQLTARESDFARTLKMVGAFSIAVNEENAAFGRIVTAPTNGSAGVIPAVLLYYRSFAAPHATDRDIADFLLVAALIGAIFKTGATISAAMGGCQAEIGVSSAMAAAALTEGLGGTPAQAVMAAEIAMEHHLGLTCDPIGGLVQIPCIERNSMGAIKAITAAHIALESDTAHARVSLDDVVRTMWQTAQDMNTRYKETSLGGLAVHVAVSIPEC